MQFPNAIVIAALLVSLPSAYAQGTLASLQGSVLDPSGSLVPQATITIQRGSSRLQTARSDAKGHYELAGLPAGTYLVRAVAAGFAQFESRSYSIAEGGRQTLDIKLALRAETSQVTVSDAAKVDVDPSNNAGAIVLTKNDLDALPDDRDDLATDLQALAGPAAGPNGGEIFIDGFTGGRLPSKQSIREIRINQNPFSAQYDRPGQGRIEIFTKPGSEDFHGEFLFQFSDAALNSRNPFVGEKPPYQRRQWEGEFGGPLGKKTSFLFDFERRDINENAFVNAITLDSNFNAVPFAQAIVTPLAGVEINGRIDRQLTKDHTLIVRYGYQGDSHENQGVGGFTLPSRGYLGLSGEQTFSVVETGVLNAHTINETRFRFRRQTSDDSGGTAAPSITVLDAFSSGGSPVGVSYDHQSRYELQNFTSYVKGAHVMRFGGLVRGVSLTNQSMQNYAGTFTFTSLDSYRLSLLGQGGGPSQFTLSAGDPLAALHQFDFGFFVQDDWRLRPNFTLSAGLRYEFQTHSSDRSDFGPRIGFAWGVGGSKSKTAVNVIRGGFGMFYDRLSESLTVDALRQNGIRQQQFLIANPDFYPTVPSLQILLTGAQPQTVRRTDANWQSPTLTQVAIGYERQLAKGISVSSNYIHSSGSHALRSRNINAPFPGTGVRPYGGVNDIYFYETSGLYRQNQWITNFNAKVGSKVTLTSFYAWGSARSNTDGAGTFPDNQYNTSSEYGRAGFDIRHRLQFMGSWSPRWGLRLSPFVTIASGKPFNIITGRDLNNDGLYTDRPAFAADLSRPNLMRTPYGIFDLMPVSGETIIPRNLGNGPGVVAVNLRVGKTFDIGHDDAGKKQSDPKQLTLSVNARNILNHPNLAAPDGNLSSLLFGRSTSLAGGQGISGNRRLDMQIKFSF